MVAHGEAFCAGGKPSFPQRKLAARCQEEKQAEKIKLFLSGATPAMNVLSILWFCDMDFDK